MKTLLKITIATALTVGFLGCKNKPTANSVENQSVGERIGHDARSVGEQTADAVGLGVKAIGDAGEAVINAISGDKDEEDNN